MKTEHCQVNRLYEMELEARVGQLVLKRVFDRLFSLVGSTKGDPQAFSCLDAALDDLFDNLSSSLNLEWGHGTFTQEERLQLGKLMADLRGFYDSQRKHLLFRLPQQRNVQPQN